MFIIEFLLATLCGLVIFFLVFPFITVLLSRFVKEKLSKPVTKQYDFGCIITAYKNAEIAKPLIDSLVKQPYNNFHIYLVADESDTSGFQHVKHEKLSIFRPEPLRLKAKSIIYAMSNFVREHEYTIVFDADNLAHPDFLQEINKYCNQGYLAVQGQRTAKNLDTIYACADALGEFYKNYIERYVTYLLGSSAVISGSGMAVETRTYRSYLESPEIEQGQHLWKKMLQEDKILQNDLIGKKNTVIAYAWNAIVYDEKVTNGDQVETQRSRWLFSYFQNFKNSSSILLKGLFGLSWNRFYFGLVTIAPPLFILVFVAFGMALVSLFVSLPWALALFGALGIFSGTVLWTLKLSNVPPKVWEAVLAIPSFILRQVKGLLKMGNPNKNFVHSEHTRNVSVEDGLKGR
jgi:cellulose synthase/poly-beta-1,6-N-acetylglucosamine synthase-like glycosyltransferase